MTSKNCGKTYRGAMGETWICATENDPIKADDYGRCGACVEKFGEPPPQFSPYKGSFEEFIDNYKPAEQTLWQRVKALFA